MSHATLEIIRERLQPLRTPDLKTLADAISTEGDKVWWTTLYKIQKGETTDPAWTLVERLRMHFQIQSMQPKPAKPQPTAAAQ